MSPKELAALLAEHGIDPRSWDQDPAADSFKKLLKKVEDKELRFHSVPARLAKSGVTELWMDTEVVATRIFGTNPIQPQIRLTLIEYQKERGKIVPRIANSGSVSGSLQEGETVRETMIREIYEELGIDLTLADLTELTELHELGEQPPPEPKVSRRFPPIVHRKTAIHMGSWEMPAHYYKPLYKEYEGKSPHSRIKAIFVWWPMAFWDLKASPPEFASWNALTEHFTKPVGAI